MPEPAKTTAVLPFIEARRVVETHAARLKAVGTESVPLLASRGRVLAEEIVADRDFPPFPRATRDGFAVAAESVTTVPTMLRFVREIKAGIAPDANTVPVRQGEAAEIMTGAPVPPGADAVVMVEYTSRSGEQVEIKRGVVAGENVVPMGAEARRGDVLLTAGRRMLPASIAVAASVGRTEVTVRACPRVAILATGDELVDIAAEPGPTQIRNSNSYSLAAQVEAAGGDPAHLRIAPDEPELLRKLIQEGLSADLLLLSGGVSMGKYDLVEQVLSSFEAEFFFIGALIQPGRPIVFGRATPRPGAHPALFFGLPGNPVSTMVCFDLFVRPILDALAGAKPRPLAYLQARLRGEVKVKTGLTRFLPALLHADNGPAEVEAVRWQGSGDIAANARADCYLVVPPDRDHLAAGEMVAVLLR